MARRSVQATFKAVDDSHIPDDLAEGAALLTDLGERGIVGDVSLRPRKPVSTRLVAQWDK